jgi:branched-chain amino acid aminotransferase
MKQARVSGATALPVIETRYRDRMNYPPGVFYTDGQYLPMSEAKVSVLDYGLLHSDATYDTVHVWKGRFFRLDLHLERFFGGVERLRLKLPIDREGVRRVLMNCVALSGLRDSYVEMICTRGSSPVFSRDPRDAVNRFMAFAVPFGSVANEEQRARGLNVGISKIVRIPPQSVDPRIKNYHWLDLVRGLFEAYDKGTETALILDLDGNVAEGPGFNVFVAAQGALKTPATSVLMGITRRTVFDLCKELSLTATEGPVSIADLKNADEVFITSTAGGIMAVTRIEGVAIAGGDVGPITKALTDLYWKKHSDPAWSEAVPYPQLEVSR